VIRLGTRGSALALAQARWVAARLPSADIVPITTSGDRGSRDDKSRFVKEIEEALLSGSVDLAVHSAKDVPGELPSGLAIVGVPSRADPLDALCGADSLASLPEGAVVGTASVRRRAQLLALRPDLVIQELRGNVDTRLRRLAEGGFDAIVLARAGLERLGRGDEGAPLGELVPAPGQGCLVLEARSDDEAASEAAGALTDGDALAALTAERAVVTALDATCNTPIGVWARSSQDDAAPGGAAPADRAPHPTGGAPGDRAPTPDRAAPVDRAPHPTGAAPGDRGSLRLTAFVGLPDGSHWIRDEFDGDASDPAALGREVASRLEAAGARDLLAEAERAAGAL
jgi:hydroxymethylbilane synthase